MHPNYLEQALSQTPEQKFAATRQAAEKGDATAQFNLGEMYNRGEGILKDHGKASEWWHKAAVQGHAEASSRLGKNAMNGR